MTIGEGDDHDSRSGGTNANHGNAPQGGNGTPRRSSRSRNSEGGSDDLQRYSSNASQLGSSSGAVNHRFQPPIRPLRFQGTSGGTKARQHMAAMGSVPFIAATAHLPPLPRLNMSTREVLEMAQILTNDCPR